MSLCIDNPGKYMLFQICFLAHISGLLHDDLQVFLESNVPKGGKKDKVVVGVSDAKIGAAITEELGIKCSHIGVVPEVIRGKVQMFML